MKIVTRQRMSAGRKQWWLALLLIAATVMPLAVAHAQTRSSRLQRERESQETFQSGSQQSLPYLREMAASLARIEVRLERIETAIRESERDE